VPMQDSESVLVQMFVKTGSRYETAAQRGVSHFLEHLLFKGTKKYPNAKILSTIVEAMGADYNAFTGKEYTVFYIKAAAKYLPLIMDVLTEMLQRPRLDQTEITREKGVIFEEMNMYRDTPMRLIGDVIEEHMWPKSDLGALIIGDEKTVGRLNRPEIAGYVRDKYTNENLIIGIAGKYDEKICNRQVTYHWGKGFAGNSASNFTPAPIVASKPKVKLEYKKTQQAHLALGFYAYSYDDPRNVTVEVLSNILGGGMSSRLFSEIRERRGLAYYVRSGTHHYQDTGMLAITSGLRLKKVDEAISVISRELRKIKSGNVQAAELKKAKENLKGRTTLSLEDSEHRLEWYLEQVAFKKKTESPGQVFKKIDKVTPAAIKAEAKKLFTQKNAKLALIGPFRGKEKQFERLLKL